MTSVSSVKSNDTNIWFFKSAYGKFIIVRIMEPFWFIMAIAISIHQVQEAEKLQKGEVEKKNDKPAFISSPFILRW